MVLVEFTVCPEERRRPALELLYGWLPSETRREQVDFILSRVSLRSDLLDGLFIAVQDDRLLAAACGIVMPGRLAEVILPQPKDSPLTGQLVLRVFDYLQNQPVDLAFTTIEPSASEVTNSSGARQSSLHTNGNSGESHYEQLLQQNGFWFGGEMLSMFTHLGSEWRTLPACVQRESQAGSVRHFPNESGLSFHKFTSNDRSRLANIIERTYVDSLDFPRMDGLRKIDDVLAGYEQTGDSGTRFWRIVRYEERDVGCLLTASHSPERIELIYTGLVPEVRGRGWGRLVLQRALRLAAESGRTEMFLAVDSTNDPAIAIYSQANFAPVGRRKVYLRRIKC